jgi:hypothetical protein
MTRHHTTRQDKSRREKKSHQAAPQGSPDGQSACDRGDITMSAKELANKLRAAGFDVKYSHEPSLEEDGFVALAQNHVLIGDGYLAAVQENDDMSLTFMPSREGPKAVEQVIKDLRTI